ncbi:serpentine type 7TM GPCR chemoreceptor str domain-containing protein [Ditylenchus destructor]|uniref:Serpentine type 7TM GPCR chemoreceptor str domain-containing protein n=1 Tax=Ditylenchus destructor TaxID=166010 RepID=A0AAD4QY82_9BILA|nr:serpentine type 7TM GPCR chemoreceptor str domain-containing protein [Ditylenchus destructor]
MILYAFIQVNSVICFIAGVVLNVTLIALTLQDGNIMSNRGHKPILLQMCITDLCNLFLTFFYMPNQSSQSLNTILITGVIVAYIVTIICGLKIWLYLKRQWAKVNVNRKKLQLYKQINYVLLVQASVPIFGNLIPFCFNSLSSILSIDTKQMPFIVQCLMSWVMVLNPILIVLIIGSYRRTICHITSTQQEKSGTAAVVVDTMVNPEMKWVIVAENWSAQ